GTAWQESGFNEEPVDGLFALAPDVELPTDDELLASSQVAAALLTGGKLRTELLPQKGLLVAPIATLIAGDRGGSADLLTDPADPHISSPAPFLRAPSVSLPFSPPPPVTLPTLELVENPAAAPERKQGADFALLHVLGLSALGWLWIKPVIEAERKRSEGEA